MAGEAGHTETTDVAAWRGLLEVMSDEELRRYGAIALDQYDRELKYWWAQVVLVGGVLVTIGLLARGLVLSGVGRLGLLGLGFSWALGYWPYRSAKTRALWWGHYKAVLAEQARRATGGTPRELEDEDGQTAGLSGPASPRAGASPAVTRPGVAPEGSSRRGTRPEIRRPGASAGGGSG